VAAPPTGVVTSMRSPVYTVVVRHFSTLRALTMLVITRPAPSKTLSVHAGIASGPE
jgi:hypothetical protein